MIPYITGRLNYAQALPDQVQELLRNQIETAGLPPKIVIGEELIHASRTFPLFYERRGYWPAWSDEKGLLSAHLYMERNTFFHSYCLYCITRVDIWFKKNTIINGE